LLLVPKAKGFDGKKEVKILWQFAHNKIDLRTPPIIHSARLFVTAIKVTTLDFDSAVQDQYINY